MTQSRNNAPPQEGQTTEQLCLKIWLGPCKDHDEEEATLQLKSKQTKKDEVSLMKYFSPNFTGL